MKKFSNVFKFFVILSLCLIFVFVSACNKPLADNSDSIGSETKSETNSETSVGSSVENSQSPNNSISHNPTNSDSFDFSYSQTPNSSKDEPSGEAQTNLPLIYAMYNLGNLDGSYNGTNAEIGFPKRNTRTIANTFETYPIGYGEGTTGGRGATSDNIYECSTGLEILSALDQIKAKQATNPDLKSIIKVTNTITQENTTASGVTTLVYQIVPNSINNISIIGANANAIFDGVGINFKTCNNVIVQNLTIHHPSKYLKNEKDCLEFNKCLYVWVDHCELYNDYPSNSSEKDYFDGMIDVKNESSHVTISYNYVHDAFKTSLVGSGPDDLCETRTITYHHNKFINLNSRVPAIRSGYGHVYNNYYENILGSTINCRIEANVYIEGNIFVKSKKPICADEDSIIGFYNIASDNVFTNCSGVKNPSDSTTTFTPSYEYTLDSTSNLKEYLDATCGVNKINVEVQCASDDGYNKKYVIDQNLLIDRGIDEIGKVSLNNESLQKLVYLSKEVLFADASVVAKLNNLSKLETAINSFIDLFVADLDGRISKLNLSNGFSENATNYLQAKADYDKCEQIIKNKITQSQKLFQVESDFNANCVALFNSEIDSLLNATADKMPAIEKLLILYEKLDDQKKALIKYTDLQNAYISANSHIIADNFEVICQGLPKVSAINHGNSQTILSAIKAYKNLTAKQLSLVEKSSMDKFAEVYNHLTTVTRKMDVSGISEKKVATESAVAGDVNLAKNMEVLHDGNISFEGTTYTHYAYISGYGNKGTKSIWFTIYSPSTVEVIINTIDSKGKIIIADNNGTVIKTVTTESSDLCKLTITDLEAGEYRFYTSMPDEAYTATKAYVYSFSIIPTK